MREPRDFPDQLHVAGTGLQSTRPVPIARPAPSGQRVAMPIDRIAVIERQVSEGNDATAARLGRSRFQARELCRRQQRLYTGADLVRRRQSKRRRPRFGGGLARREITDGVKASRILQLPAHAKGRGQRAQLADFLDQGPQGRVRRRSLHQLGNTGGVTRRSGVLEHGCPRLGAQHFPHPCEPRRRLRIPQEPLDPARFPQPAAACPGRAGPSTDR